MISLHAFETLVPQLAALNNIDEDTAGDYAARIGDTPIIEDGLCIVRDDEGNVVARVRHPWYTDG